LRRLLAYASVSHVGLVIVGIASLTMQGIQGAIFQLLNFTMVAGSLMLVAGFIQHRLGSTEAIHLGGLAKVMPRLTCFYFLFALASIGLPGTSGFPAELLLIVSTMLAHPGISIAALVGAILSAAYMLPFTRRAFFGPVTQIGVKQVQDLRPRELALLCVSALLILGFGFFPNSVLKTNRATAEVWLSRLMDQPVLASKAEQD
jgi:NADH-quinone oxidoreductase subunit M